MTQLTLTPDDIAQVRFGHSAVWDATASLYALNEMSTAYLHRPLHQAAAKAKGSLHPLRELTTNRHWIPDALAPTPNAAFEAPEDEIGRVADTPAEVAEADLECIRRTMPESAWAAMDPQAYAETLSRRLLSYWHSHLAQHWNHVSHVARADVAQRELTLSAAGVGPCMSSVDSRVTYCDGTLQVELPGHSCSKEGEGLGLWFLTSVFRWPMVAFSDRPRQPCVVSYAAIGSGRIWQQPGADGSSLAALIGTSRAALLRVLDVPRSTTQLAVELGLAPGTVSSHLAILDSVGAVNRRREGRVVLYTRAAFGDLLLSQGGAPGYSELT